MTEIKETSYPTMEVTLTHPDEGVEIINVAVIDQDWFNDLNNEQLCSMIWQEVNASEYYHEMTLKSMVRDDNRLYVIVVKYNGCDIIEEYTEHYELTHILTTKKEK